MSTIVGGRRPDDVAAGATTQSAAATARQAEAPHVLKLCNLFSKVDPHPLPTHLVVCCFTYISLHSPIPFLRGQFLLGDVA